MMVQRLLLVLFAFAFFIFGNVFADQGRVREVRSWIEGRWAVVDVETISGSVVILSPLVGREIDFEERNRFAVFEGENTYNQKARLFVFKTPIAGFQSAVFLKMSDDTYGVRITYRNEMGLQYRFLPIKNRNDLIRMRDYLSSFGEDASDLSDYPMETDEVVTFETVRPAFQPRQRLMGKLVLDDGEELKGELLPVVEAGHMMVDTRDGFRRVDIAAIQQVGIGGRGTSGILSKTVRGAIYWGFTGGMTGLMSGFFYEGLSAREQMLYGLVIGSTVGGAVGFLDGLFSIQPGKTFHLGSMDKQNRPRLEISPMQIRLRF